MPIGCKLDKIRKGKTGVADVDATHLLIKSYILHPVSNGGVFARPARSADFPAGAQPKSGSSPFGPGLMQKSQAIIEIQITLTMGIAESKLSFEQTRGPRGFNGIGLNCSGHPLAVEISYSLDGVENGTINVPCAGLNKISPTVNWS